MGEQDTALAAVAALAAKQASSLSAIARATVEQASASEQLARNTGDMRTRAKEVVAGIAQTVKNSALIANEVGGIAKEIARIREANVQHADAVASITGALIEGRGQQLVPRVEKA
jgi:hypothetical protein